MMKTFILLYMKNKFENQEKSQDWQENQSMR